MTSLYVANIRSIPLTLIFIVTTIILLSLYLSARKKYNSSKTLIATLQKSNDDLNISERRLRRSSDGFHATLNEKESVISALRKELATAKHDLYCLRTSPIDEEKISDEIRTRLSSLATRERLLLEREQEIHALYTEFDNHLTNIIQDYSAKYPYMAVQLADMAFLRDMQLSDALKSKVHPAKKASDEVAAIAKEKRDLFIKCKALEYQLAFYESLDPSLTALSDYTINELYEASYSHNDYDSDSVKEWLSASEYDALSAIDRYQLALDRWKTRQRSNWQVGRDFERYVGYCYEMDGWNVSYCGAINGKSDLCRDLIAKKGNQTEIIQCKRWTQNKIIHEKHIFQLFGSVVAYRIANPNSNPTGHIITTCSLSDMAIEFASALNIRFSQNYPSNQLSSYPLIKCNISKTGEKIFHLPFDQQYDRVSIDLKAGECYVATVQEAVNAGYRRAYRWQGQSM